VVAKVVADAAAGRWNRHRRPIDSNQTRRPSSRMRWQTRGTSRALRAVMKNAAALLLILSIGLGCEAQDEPTDDNEQADQGAELVTTCVARREMVRVIMADGTELPAVNEQMPIVVDKFTDDAGPPRLIHRVSEASIPIALQATLLLADPDRVEILFRDDTTDFFGVSTGAFGTDFDGTPNPKAGLYFSAQFHQKKDGRDERTLMVCCRNTTGDCKDPLTED
jgi:hypothetical protein